MQLVELIPQTVPGEEDRSAILGSGNLAHRVLIVVGQLDRFAASGRLAPEVELAGGVGDIRDVRTFRRKGEGGMVAVDGGEPRGGCP